LAKGKSMSWKSSLSVGVWLCLFTALAWAFSSNPPDARTGAPGESTCADCHGNLNSGIGGVSIAGPQSYQPGDTLDLTVIVQQSGQSRWGFEVTVLDESNDPVGNMLVYDGARTQLSTDGVSGREYVKHTLAGTDAGNTDISPGWVVRWVSPESTHGPVTFYAVGNAADNNGGSSGDFIYTASFSYDENQVEAENSTWGGIKSLFR